MRILLVHNHYQQAGGEDQVFAAESRLLAANGHDVIRYTLHNDAIDGMNRLRVAARTIFSRSSYRELRKLMRRERPDVMHATNTFPLVSPAAYYAARREGVPVVQSLHNYRLLCANALFLRDGKPCEDCLGRSAMLPAIRHACYRDSRAGSAVVAAMAGVHRALGTWRRLVDRYIALSEFSRGKFIAGGLPAEKIAVKPNFVDPDPGIGAGRGGYALFVGRLSAEKGIETLLAAWRTMRELPPLVVVGDGPLAKDVAAAHERGEIRWLGRRPHAEVIDLLKQAACLVLPSTTYENCPMSLIESLAVGTPVIGSRIGAIAEMIADGRTGHLFKPGDAADLQATMRRFAADDAGRESMRRAAREAFLARYTAADNLRQLTDVYAHTIAARRERIAVGTAPSNHPAMSAAAPAAETLHP